MKVGLVMLLAMTILVVAGASNGVFAVSSIQQSTCSSGIAYNCYDNRPQLCSDPNPSIPLQIQAAVITPGSLSDVQIAPVEMTRVARVPSQPPTYEYNLDSNVGSDPAVLDSDKIFNLINQYRESVGLSPFVKDDSVCELARVRSAEIPLEIKNGTLHLGLYNRSLPYWIFENAKYGSNEEGTVAWWLASPLHHESIVADYKYSCVKCSGSFCSELFTSFSPK